MIKKKNKSQEEMVGFVLIVILVSIIALVFLAISINKKTTKLPSSEIESFFQSAMRYSTDCYSSMERRYDIRDLIKACYNSEMCLNGTACEELNKTLSNMLKESWKIGKERPVKYYQLNIYDKTNKTIIKLREGNCTGIISGTRVLVSEEISAEFDICS